ALAATDAVQPPRPERCLLADAARLGDVAQFARRRIPHGQPLPVHQAARDELVAFLAPEQVVGHHFATPVERDHFPVVLWLEQLHRSAPLANETLAYENNRQPAHRTYVWRHARAPRILPREHAPSHPWVSPLRDRRTRRRRCDRRRDLPYI